MDFPLVNIAIPTYNRDYCLAHALRAALEQTYPNFTVTVVDDGSTDDTRNVVESFFDDERLTYIRLKKNVGTARAKNVALALSEFDAITFHDSDDIPFPHKVLLQARAMFGTEHTADEILDWKSFGYKENSDLNVDVVVGAHEFIRLDGTSVLINRRVTLVDDFFPNVQFPAKCEGDWILINSGLFRKGVFEELGGFLHSVEEDRELRNRTLAAGCVYYFVEEPLLRKIEMKESLTVGEDTGYISDKRIEDRKEAWRRTSLYRNGLIGPKVAEECSVPLDLSDVEIAEIAGGGNLKLNTTFPAASQTWRNIKDQCEHLKFTSEGHALKAVGR